MLTEGVECRCPYGYELSDDESSCQDINECEIYDNYDDEQAEEEEAAKATYCSHTCTNLIGLLYPNIYFLTTFMAFASSKIPGSFVCSCPENFHIHDDKRTCVRDYCADLDNIQLNKTKCSHDCVDEHEGGFL